MTLSGVSVRLRAGNSPPSKANALRLIGRGFARISRDMTRFFDIADHDRLPWRFTALDRSVLARL